LKLIPQARCPVVTYGFNPQSRIRAEKIELNEQGSRFELFDNENRLGMFQSPLSGKHNLQNLLGVIALCLGLGFPLKRIQSAVLEFKGVKRRQEVRGVVNGITVIDDFAHHPTAVQETIDAIRNRYPHQKIWVVFEPRSNTSRRNIFQKDFAKAFSHADQTIIADVFMPEKVKDVPLLDVNALIEEIQAEGGKAVGGMKVDQIIEYLENEVKSGEVVLIMSNGGFENIHERLLERLRKKTPS
jgi:UDP-N-acetylmuramate: L-alanyl-gamma-D-glutamyl-meso-diaminopimelate ligase